MFHCRFDSRTTKVIDRAEEEETRVAARNTGKLIAFIYRGVKSLVPEKDLQRRSVFDTVECFSNKNKRNRYETVVHFFKNKIQIENRSELIRIR